MRCLHLCHLGLLTLQRSSKLHHSSRIVSPVSWSRLAMASSTSSSSITSTSKTFVVDPFCFRQFAENPSSVKYSGAVFSVSVADFESTVNERYQQQQQPALKDGYAPFCKHLFLINDFTDARVNVLPITTENEQYLRTKYEARTDQELPVLTRWFPANLVVSDDQPLPVAKYLDLILYSRDQINKENQATGKDSTDETAPWGIVSIKAQDVDYELPMTPITMMRNALGKEEGGSGVPLPREDYLAAVRYWKDHATVV